MSNPLELVYEFLCVAAVTGWVLSRPLMLFLPSVLANLVGLGAAIALGICYLIWPYSGWVVAIFSPVSLGIAIYAVVDMTRPFGVIAPRWSLAELGAGLAAYCVYIYASLGWIMFDPYALGFSGGASFGVPVVLAGYAYWRKDWVLGGIIVGAQALWMAGIGSENLFDHLVSALVVPAILIGVARRVRGGKRLGVGAVCEHFEDHADAGKHCDCDGQPQDAFGHGGCGGVGDHPENRVGEDGPAFPIFDGFGLDGAPDCCRQDQ